MIARSEIDLAKDRLSIPTIWQFLKLPGRPAASCRSPFRRDRRSSFSVYQNGQRWKDHATSEGGDSISFFAKARGIEMSQALSEYVELANGRITSQPAAPVIWAPKTEDSSKRPNLKNLRIGTRFELETLAALRNIDPQAVELAQEMGTLRFGHLSWAASWILMDQSGICAEGRRLDGKFYVASGSLSSRKAHSIRGSTKSWPVGILPASKYREFESIAFIEGAPDYLAVLHFMARQNRSGILPVAILGRASTRISPEALKYFKGKRVRIFPHNDADGGGLQSAKDWARQLASVGASVDFFSFEDIRKRNGSPVKDLNDCADVGPEFSPRLEGLFPDPRIEDSDDE
jgi:hypothetical protein